MLLVGAKNSCYRHIFALKGVPWAQPWYSHALARTSHRLPWPQQYTTKYLYQPKIARRIRFWTFLGLKMSVESIMKPYFPGLHDLHGSRTGRFSWGHSTLKFWFWTFQRHLRAAWDAQNCKYSPPILLNRWPNLPTEKQGLSINRAAVIFFVRETAQILWVKLS